MYTRSIYLPSNALYMLQDADAYIRSAFTIPKSAIATDTTSSTGVLTVSYTKNDTIIAFFTCYLMSAHKNRITKP